MMQHFTLSAPSSETITGTADAQAERAIRATAHRLSGSPDDFGPLLSMVGDASFVLIGEASHGTHEFYRIRAEITKRLIGEHGFTAVAVEADWPDAYRVNRFVRGQGDDADAEEALGGFLRFPQWMWRNADVLDFVGWLRAHNEGLAERRQVGFYGLDLYSLHASMHAVLGYLDLIDPAAAERARRRYDCFELFGEDPADYGRATVSGLTASCESAVAAQLAELLRSSAEYARRDGRAARDALFAAEQNARVARDAEAYYRAMFRSRVGSWNLRDRHMFETLEALVQFHHAEGLSDRMVIWAHNSHLGDARATEMGAVGELNLGQLIRQQHGRATLLTGMLTGGGTVTASSNWDAPAERKVVRPPLRGSHEALLRAAIAGNFHLPLRGNAGVRALLREPRLQRAIGVIYRPESERESHYFRARLPEQFDSVLYYDVTRAVEPLERSGRWLRGEVPETYPTAL